MRINKLLFQAWESQGGFLPDIVLLRQAPADLRETVGKIFQSLEISGFILPMLGKRTYSPGQVLSALRYAEIKLLFDVLENTQFWIKDADGRFLHVNQTWLLFFSIPSIEDAVGLTDFDVSPAWISEAFRADDAAVLRGKRIMNRIEMVAGFSHQMRWFRTSKVPLRDQSGEIVATAGVTRPLPGLETPEFPVPQLAPALAAMQNEPDVSWTNTTLAKLAGLSVSAFERQFRRHLQTSPMQFLKHMRLSRAAAALIQTNRPISDIAFEFGFSDQAHFSREFKRTYNATPSGWRQLYLLVDNI